MPVRKIVPNDRPRISEDLMRLHLHTYQVEVGLNKDFYTPIALLGIRGYYKKTTGATPENERNIYDDCLCVLSPSVYATFNANTDPSYSRRGMAVLVPGSYQYGLGVHRGQKAQYNAIVQVGAVTVLRDGVGVVSDDPPRVRFGINIHKGGFTNTSSEGCQTIYPEQWPAFYALVAAECARYKVTRFPYVLIEQ